MTAASEALEPGIPAEVRRMLEHADYAHLATLLPDGPRAWDIIDRIARKHTGQPYPLRINRIVLLIEADHAQAVTFG